MWNAYHIMSNRARVVCYAARSVQFRALTKLTANKLMKYAHSQIEALSSLKVIIDFISTIVLRPCVVPGRDHGAHERKLMNTIYETKERFSGNTGITVTTQIRM